MTSDFLQLLPELTLVALVTLLAGLEFLGPALRNRFSPVLTTAGVLSAAAGLVYCLQNPGSLWGGMFRNDLPAVFFKFLFLVTAVLVLEMARGRDWGAEFRLVLWSSVLGMFCLVSSGHFLVFFVSLELMTLSLYILASYSCRDLHSIEAGIKYLVMGSLASAFLLYGTSLIYASTGILSFAGLGHYVSGILAAGESLPLLWMIGCLLVLTALGFKVGAVPFHAWIPDVYQGAPTPVVAFLSVASKSAGFAALARIFFEILGPLGAERRVLFSLLAALTILYGNLGALRQKNMKRLLGYSSIGHAGYLLITLASEPALGGVSLFYYLMAYAVSNLTAFSVVSVIEAREGSSEIEAYRGLSRRSPLLAATFFIALLSLAGVPPLAGFFGKFFILLQAARAQLYGIVFLGTLSVAVSLYYYLSVVRVLYFERPFKESPIAVSFSAAAVLILLSAGIVVIGIWQKPFFQIAWSVADKMGSP